MSDIPIYHFLPYSFETGFLTEVQIELVPSKLQGSSLSPSPTRLELQVCMSTPGSFNTGTGGFNVGLHVYTISSLV